MTSKDEIPQKFLSKPSEPKVAVAHKPAKTKSTPEKTRGSASSAPKQEQKNAEKNAPTHISFTTRLLEEETKHLNAYISDFKKMKEKSLPVCAKADSLAACFISYVPTNPPLSGSQFGVVSAKGVEMALADKDSGVLSKEVAPLTISETIIVTLENTNPKKALVATLSKDPADAEEQKIAKEAEEAAMAEGRKKLNGVVTKMLDGFEKTRLAASAEEHKKRYADLRKRFDALSR
ncbi:MAG: hypothetical protein ACXWQJ_11495 [Bdellovibrionota bacterium]